MLIISRPPAAHLPCLALPERYMDQSTGSGDAREGGGGGCKKNIFQGAWTSSYMIGEKWSFLVSHAFGVDDM